MHKLTFYVPVEHKEKVKAALFAAGAGRIGRYECCAWEVLGAGQYRPTEGATPAIGEVGRLEVVQEYRVEMVLPDVSVAAVIAALRGAHPYEEPAFDLLRLVDTD
jgi:hypothetical protein